MAATVRSGRAQERVSTATAWKFGYLLEQLLPVLAGLLSHTLAKQTVADAFAMDAALTSALLEQALSSPATAVQPVISDLLALSDDGVTASFYSNATASGTPTSTTTLAGISVDGTTVTLPGGTGSATFTSWLTVPARKPSLSLSGPTALPARGGRQSPSRPRTLRTRPGPAAHPHRLPREP